MDTKVALITGGSRGIGLGIARSLADTGCHLAINGMRSEESIGSTLAELRQIGVDVLYCRGNVGEANDRERIIRQTLDHFGQLNILVNNAGVAPSERSDVLEMSEDSYDRVMGINLKGAFFLSQAAAKAMIRTKESHPGFQACIINISSISATIASINRGEYCISKAGMTMVTKLLATRLGEVDIQVYEIRPGVIKTDMTEVVQQKYDHLIEKGLTITPRWGYPEDVGKVAAALVQGDFPYSTGQVIMVDGGLTIPRL